jgi:hypothetical protein
LDHGATCNTASSGCYACGSFPVAKIQTSRKTYNSILVSFVCLQLPFPYTKVSLEPRGR